jgi:hypothetical protein
MLANDPCSALTILLVLQRSVMFVLSLSDVASFDMKNAPDFVEFWDRFYGYEANLPEDKGYRMSEQNVRRLLRWKDPRFLTDPKKGTGQPNEKVRRVINSISLINSFRRGEETEYEMRRAAENIFGSPTIVWRALLLHIAKPHIHPIADQNVFRSYSLHTGNPEPQTWQGYTEYSNYFGQIADRMKIARTPDNVRELKKIDNAPYVFGQFLLTYNRQ